MGRFSPSVGIGYRFALDNFTEREAERLDVLEITLDHYLWAGAARKNLIENLVGRFPLVSHGIGLSLGTAAPINFAYMEKISRLIELLGISYYSEHLAFTGVPGCELANLLPLPRSEIALQHAITNVRDTMQFLDVPFYLENITSYFDYPDSVFSHAEFLNTICAETGAGVLLDVENVFITSTYQGLDPIAFIDELRPGFVGCVHVAGGNLFDGMLVDSHDRPIRDEVVALLKHTLLRHRPHTIILERDRRMEAVDEILDDLSAIRRCVLTGESDEGGGPATRSAG